jgi:hypothetical protein
MTPIWATIVTQETLVTLISTTPDGTVTPLSRVRSVSESQKSKSLRLQVKQPFKSIILLDAHGIVKTEQSKKGTQPPIKLSFLGASLLMEKR